MVKRSTDQKLRLRNLDARNEKFCTGEVVKSQRRSRAKGMWYQWKEKSSDRRETNAVSGMRVTIVPNRHQKPRHLLSHEHQEVEVRREKGGLEAEASLGSPTDSRAKTSWKVLALNHFRRDGILPNVNSLSLNRVVNLAQSAFFRTGRLRNIQTKKSRKGDDKSAGAISKRVRFTRAALRQATIREKEGPSLEKTQVKIPHQRSPYAMKYEDRSPEETARQERCARGDAWRTKLHCIRLPIGGFCRPQTRRKESLWWTPEQACRLSAGKTLALPNWKTVTISESPASLVTANGEVLTKGEATVYVRELDLVVTVTLLEDTPAVLSFGKLCENHDKTYHWTSGQKPHPINNGRKINCNTGGTGRPVGWASRIRKPKEKWHRRGITEWPVARCARLATGVQAWIGRWKCARTSRRFQFFSWITFGAASKSGVGRWLLTESALVQSCPERKMSVIS